MLAKQQPENQEFNVPLKEKIWCKNNKVGLFEIILVWLYPTVKEALLLHRIVQRFNSPCFQNPVSHLMKGC